MDKLRALQYFIAAAQERSFSGAARRLEVSIPAVARLVGSLERALGLTLFDRSAQGLALTADGDRYLAACLPLVQRLAEVDEAMAGAVTHPRGTLVVGAPRILLQHCLLPALPSFHERFPDIQVDAQPVERVSTVQANTAEVLVLLGWPEHPGLVHRRIAQTRYLVCAAPSYWDRHGRPQRPKDLERAECLLYRDSEGTILDLWEFEGAAGREAVAVRGWLVSGDRDVLLDAALAGTGVARFTDLTVRRHLEAGRLEPVLFDWEARHAPPVNLLYRASQRRTPRVRHFVDFVADLFRELDAARAPAVAGAISTERPHWYRRRHGRASASPGGRAKRA